jgi:hypothetical protein
MGHEVESRQGLLGVVVFLKRREKLPEQPRLLFLLRDCGNGAIKKCNSLSFDCFQEKQKEENPALQQRGG